MSLLGCVSGEDSSLNGSTVSDGLIGVDRLVGFLSTEEVGDELLNSGDTSGTSDKNDFVDGLLVDLGVTENLLDGFHGSTEEILAELFESSTSDRGVEVYTFEEGVDFDGGLGGGREGSLSTLASSAETTKSTSVRGEVLLVLALELGSEVSDETKREKARKVSTTKNGQEGRGKEKRTGCQSPLHRDECLRQWP